MPQYAWYTEQSIMTNLKILSYKPEQLGLTTEQFSDVALAHAFVCTPVPQPTLLVDIHITLNTVHCAKLAAASFAGACK